MSILDIKNKGTKYKCKKTVLVYMIISALTIAVNKIYTIFGHGVSSDAMTWMFIYPLIGGAIFYLMGGLLLPELNRFVGYRLFYNIYNSGIAALTIGSLLKGIMEIAGTGSSYLKLYYMIGYAFITVALTLFTLLAANYKKVSVRKPIVE